MKIHRFSGKNVNGHLNFDIKFNSDLTFVTGINGTGKTSALNCIIALLRLRFDYLAKHPFDEINLWIKLNKKTYIVTAEKSEQKTVISSPQFKREKIILDDYSNQRSMFPPEDEEYKGEYWRKVSHSFSNYKLVEMLQSLSPPIFLGLDRRANLADFDNYRFRMERNHIKHRRSHKDNIFGRSLPESLEVALAKARKKHKINKRLSDEIDQQLHNELFLTLLNVQPVKLRDRGFVEPTQDEMSMVEQARNTLSQLLPHLLDIEQEQINESLSSIFRFLDERQKIIENKNNVDTNEDHRRLAIFEWSLNHANLSKFNQMLEMISARNEAVKENSVLVDQFLKTINGFFVDSGKEVRFDSSGDLYFSISGNDEERDIRTMSSGEIQLIVILTHLYFASEDEQETVFMIDEPELSLHVQWQEKFVDAVMKASQKTQFVMATHAPSIILNRTDKCVDLTMI